MGLIRTIDPPSGRLFAVGDLHGCGNELRVLLAHMTNELALAPSDLVIFIGDYVDRGPSTSEVLEALLEFQARFPQCIFLKGNHEDMMLDYLGYGGTLGNSYLINGGADTLISYGVSVLEEPQKIRTKLPPTHIEFLLALEAGVMVDKLLFVHAGINPKLPLEEQSPSELYWIRDEFILARHNLDLTVIFGHTPHQDLFIHWPWKIGIDTGACFGNMLSCIELTSKKVYQVLTGDKRVLSKDLAIPA